MNIHDLKAMHSSLMRKYTSKRFDVPYSKKILLKTVFAIDFIHIRCYNYYLLGKLDWLCSYLPSSYDASLLWIDEELAEWRLCNGIDEALDVLSSIHIAQLCGVDDSTLSHVLSNHKNDLNLIIHMISMNDSAVKRGINLWHYKQFMRGRKFINASIYGKEKLFGSDILFRV